MVYYFNLPKYYTIFLVFILDTGYNEVALEMIKPYDSDYTFLGNEAC